MSEPDDTALPTRADYERLRITYARAIHDRVDPELRGSFDDILEAKRNLDAYVESMRRQIIVARAERDEALNDLADSYGEVEAEMREGLYGAAA